MMGLVGAEVNRDEMADMKREVTVPLGVDGSVALDAVVPRLNLVGVVSGVAFSSRADAGRGLPVAEAPNQPAMPPLGLPARVAGLLSPVKGI